MGNTKAPPYLKYRVEIRDGQDIKIKKMPLTERERERREQLPEDGVLVESWDSQMGLQRELDWSSSSFSPEPSRFAGRRGSDSSACSSTTAAGAVAFINQRGGGRWPAVFSEWGRVAAGGVLGKKIVPEVVDPASNWPLFAEKAKELILEKKVAVTFGCWTSVSRKSCLPVFEEYNQLLFYPVQYEGEEQSLNVFYTGATPNQQLIPAAEYLMSEDGGNCKKFYLVSQFFSIINILDFKVVYTFC